MAATGQAAVVSSLRAVSPDKLAPHRGSAHPTTMGGHFEAFTSPSSRYEFSRSGSHLSPLNSYQQLVPVQQVQLQPMTVDRIVEVEKPIYIEVEKIVEKEVEVEKIVEKEVVVVKQVPVEVPVEKIVDRFVTVEKEVVVVKHVEIPVEKIVDRFVEVEKEKIVERLVEVPVEKIVVQQVEVPVEKIVQVESQPEQCDTCKNFVHKDKQCSVCPLVQRLNSPQAPVIISQAGVKWCTKDSEEITVQVVHSRKDGWQNMCPVTLYVTIDGSEPGIERYNFVGPSPLSFQISQSSCVKALAISEENVPSTLAVQEFTCVKVAGIGALLEKFSDLKGIYVQEMVPGGSVWQQGTIEAGDEIKSIDGVNIENFELKAIEKLVIGPVGSQILREDRDEEGNHSDEVGFEFVVTVTRQPVNKEANPNLRNPPISIEALEGYRRREIQPSEQWSRWRSGMLIGSQSLGSFSSQRLRSSQDASQATGDMHQQPARAPRMQRSAAPPAFHAEASQQPMPVPRRMAQPPGMEDESPRFDASGLVLPLWGSSGGRAAWQEPWPMPEPIPAEPVQKRPVMCSF